MPWHYFLMTAMPNWYPGTNLPVVYFLGGLIVVFECLGIALCFVACPRSGSIYVPVSRGVSPFLAMLEAWRSIITNPTQRGITAFLGAGQFASLVVITGQLSHDSGLIAAGQAFAGNVWLLVGIGLIMQIMKLDLNFGDKMMGEFTLIEFNSPQILQVTLFFQIRKYPQDILILIK